MENQKRRHNETHENRLNPITIMLKARILGFSVKGYTSTVDVTTVDIKIKNVNFAGGNIEVDAMKFPVLNMLNEYVDMKGNVPAFSLENVCVKCNKETNDIISFSFDEFNISCQEDDMKLVYKHGNK